jgi:hypothetical protein
MSPNPADAPAQCEKDDAYTSKRDEAHDRPPEVEYKCGMFMVLPFYFTLVPAKH